MANIQFMILNNDIKPICLSIQLNWANRMDSHNGYVQFFPGWHMYFYCIQMLLLLITLVPQVVCVLMVGAPIISLISQLQLSTHIWQTSQSIAFANCTYSWKSQSSQSWQQTETDNIRTSSWYSKFNALPTLLKLLCYCPRTVKFNIPNKNDTQYVMH